MGEALMSDRDSLNQRLEFLELEAGAPALRSLRPAIEKALGPALDGFYEKVKATPELARHFKDDAHIARAKGAQQSLWRLIADGDYANDYVENVRRIGMTHARIGLEPRWY